MSVKIINPLTVVKTGGGPTPGPLDPAEVYREKRPANWLKMPTPTDDEYFLLLDVGDNLVDTLPVAIQVTNSPDWTLELGTTDAQGVFTADPDLVATGTGTKTISVPANKWQDVGSTRQLMARVKINTFSSASTVAYIQLNPSSTPLTFLRSYLVELSGKSGGRTRTSSCQSLRRLMFYSIAGELPSDMNFQDMFAYCASLIAILQLDTSLATDLNRMFAGCYSLVAIPQLDTSSCTNFQQMFIDCRSLVAIPQLDTSSGVVFSYMLQGCYSLQYVPQLNTSSGTNFGNMFNSCYSLTAIPQLDTSSGTDFSYMFNNCYAIIAIPQLDTSAGTSFANMFANCSSLISIPQLGTSAGTGFADMFRNCYSLTTIPQLNTSSGKNFSNMFNGCSSLTSCDLTGYNFSAITSTTALSSILSPIGVATIDFGDTFGASGIVNAGQIISSGASANYPCKIRINKTDAMLQIAANASTLFYGTYTYVYVPDDLLATYQADTYWSTLGTRLKAMSEWSA